MANAPTAGKHVVRYFMTGLDEPLARDLASALERQGCRGVASARVADVVFGPAKNDILEGLIRRVGRRPVIAVSGIAETNHWLDALEAGAADYCVAPFEGIHLRWLLDRHCGPPRAAAAVA